MITKVWEARMSLNVNSEDEWVLFFDYELQKGNINISHLLILI